MKYLFFFSALLGILPGVVLLLCFRKTIRWAIFVMFLPLLLFNSSAINFFSHEWYRGTARGMEVFLIYFIALILSLTVTYIKGFRRLFPEWGFRIYLLYFLYSCLSLINSADRLISFFELWKMIMIYLVFLAVYHYLEFNFGDTEIIMFGFLGIVIPCGLLVVWQHLQGIYQAYGVFPHRNSMAMAMNMLGMIFLAHCFGKPGLLLDKVYLFAFALTAMSVVFSYSRGALVCFPIGAVIVVGFSLLNRPSYRKVYLVCTLGVAGLLLMFLFLPKVIERFERAPEASKNTRVELAECAMNMMKDCSWVGVGINNWGIKINPPYTYSEARRDENDMKDDFIDGIVETVYLLIGAECGIPCLVIFISFLLYYLWSCILLMIRLRHTSYFYYPLGVLGGLVNIGLQSCLEWVLKQQMNFILMMAMFAVISFMNKNHKKLVEMEKEEKERLPQRPSKPFVMQVVSTLDVE